MTLRAAALESESARRVAAGLANATPHTASRAIGPK